MDMYLIRDMVANSTVAVVDGEQMSMEDAFDALRKENKELTEQRDLAVECIEMFIKSCGSCALCAKMDCKLRDKHRTWDSPCSPIWSGHLDAAAC